MVELSWAKISISILPMDHGWPCNQRGSSDARATTRCCSPLSSAPFTFICCLTQARPTSTHHSPSTFPDQTYKTVPFSAPRVASSKLGTTTPGFLFLSLFGRDIHAPAPLIMSEEGQLIWRARTNGTVTTFGVQELDGKQVLSYWNGTIYHERDVAYGAIEILGFTVSAARTWISRPSTARICQAVASWIPTRVRSPPAARCLRLDRV